jgi:serine/threonine protein kinase
MPLLPSTRVGAYEILALIGQGGMGEVYRARDTRLGRDVAVKVLPPNFASDPDRMGRFEREARVLASLQHSNIAVLHGLEESGDLRALVMELVEGPTLADRIAQGPIPIEEAVPIALQIIEALDYAHERGVIHRDLKPANVKLTPEGSGSKVKLLDFGLAKALTDAPVTTPFPDSPTLTLGATQAGVILGTAAYMSPEQVNGKPADRRADIWAFGVVLYEMLTARRPFQGDTTAEILSSVMKDSPPLALTPVPMRPLLRRCLQKNPRQRLQAIGEARIALENPAPAEIPTATRVTRRAAAFPADQARDGETRENSSSLMAMAG